MAHFSQLKADLDKGIKQNFYIFTGEEREVLRKYIKRIDPKAKTVDSFKQLAIRFQNNGLFNQGAHGTFVIYNDKTIEDYELKKLLKLIGSDTIILVMDKIDGRSKFFKSAKGFITEFAKFEDHQLVGYIQKLIDIDSNLALLLSRLCNNEVSRIENEVHKLSFFEKDKITFELIMELVPAPLEDRIFDMVNFIAKKEAKKAFELYYDLIELKESPIKMISLLYTKFKQVFLVQFNFQLSNIDLAAKTGLTFAQVGYARELCGIFSLDQLVEILKEFQQLEVDMKTGKVDIELGMSNTVVNILTI